MFNEKTVAFFVLLYTCVFRDYMKKEYDPIRHLRFVAIAHNQWEIETWRLKILSEDYQSRCDGSKMNIDKYAALVEPEARLRLFILCMDIISAGDPICDRDGVIITRLREALQINSYDFENIMWYCRHRNNGLNIKWEKGERVRG